MMRYICLDKLEAKKAIIEDSENFFFNHLTICDIELRMKESLGYLSLNEVKEKYRQFIQTAVVEADQYQKGLIEKAFTEINEMLRLRHITFKPEQIRLVITNGNEEFGKGYTRNNTIFTPISYFEREYFQLLAYFSHEIFHIYSRYNPLTRLALYKLIGFWHIPDIAVSNELAERKINNPDATDYRYAIRIDDKIYVPYVSVDNYSFPLEKDSFKYINAKYHILKSNKLNNVDFDIIESITGVYELNVEKEVFNEYKHRLYDHISFNTGYIIHPEEIIADNFSLLLLSSKYEFVYKHITKQGKKLQQEINEKLSHDKNEN